MKKSIKFIAFILLTGLVMVSCTVAVKPEPILKVKVKNDNGKHKGHYK